MHTTDSAMSRGHDAHQQGNKWFVTIYPRLIYPHDKQVQIMIKSGRFEPLIFLAMNKLDALGNAPVSWNVQVYMKHRAQEQYKLCGGKFINYYNLRK